MDDLDKFKKELASLMIGRPTHLRPFVCDGSPLECEAFIVGSNPATTMDDDFWSFWHSGHGFDKAAWFDAYKKDRMSRPLKPGKTRRNPVSNTRRVIDWIVEGASPVLCLETNIFAASSERKADLPQAQRDAGPFEFLRKTIEPKIIVAHGKPAQRHLGGLHLSARIILVDDLSRGWSRDDAFKLGRRIKAEC